MWYIMYSDVSVTKTFSADVNSTGKTSENVVHPHLSSYLLNATCKLQFMSTPLADASPTCVGISSRCLARRRSAVRGQFRKESLAPVTEGDGTYRMESGAQTQY